MSENTVNAALRRLGYTNDEMTAHGFRAMARTVMAEQLHGIQPDVIEAQLAHGKSGPLGAAYDRAEFMDKRGFQSLADFRGIRRNRVVAHSQIKRPDTVDYHGGYDEEHEGYAKPAGALSS